MTNRMTDIDEMSEIMRQTINHFDDDSNAVASLTQFPSITAVLSSLSVCMKAFSSSVCHYFLPA